MALTPGARRARRYGSCGPIWTTDKRPNGEEKDASVSCLFIFVHMLGQFLALHLSYTFDPQSQFKMMERLDQSERVVLLTSLVVVALTAVLFVPIVRRVRTIVGRIHLQRLLVAGKTSTGTKDSKNTTDRRFRGTVTGLFIYPGKW